jgi:hypothetical protein
MALLEECLSRTHSRLSAPDQQWRCTGPTDRCRCPLVFGFGCYPPIFLPFWRYLIKTGGCGRSVQYGKRVRGEIVFGERQRVRVEKYFGGAGRAWGSRICAEPAAGQHRKPEGKGQQFDHVRCQCGRRPLRHRPTVRRTRVPNQSGLDRCRSIHLRQGDTLNQWWVSSPLAVSR